MKVWREGGKALTGELALRCRRHSQRVDIAEAVEGPVSLVELAHERFVGVVGQDGGVGAGAGVEGRD